MDTGLQWYLNSIGREPLLTPAEELHLGQLIRAWRDHPDGPDGCPPAVRRRGMRARDRFVKANLRLAVSYVRNRCQRIVRAADADDVIQAANLGLLRAVELFDPARGYKFSTYAYWWIRQSTTRFADTQVRLLKIPGQHSQLISKIQKAAREYTGATGDAPSVEVLSVATGLDCNRIRELLEEARTLASLDQVVGEDLPLGELLASPDAEPPEETPELLELRAGLVRLPPLQRELLELRHGFHGAPLTHAEAAAHLGLQSAAQARQLERQALEQLRAPPAHAEPERFAGRVGDQLQLPCELTVLIGGRADAGSVVTKRRIAFKRRDAAEGAVEQMLLIK